MKLTVTDLFCQLNIAIEIAAPNSTKKSELEFVSLFVIYAHYRQRFITYEDQEKQPQSFSELLQYLIVELSTNESTSAYLVGIKSLVNKLIIELAQIYDELNKRIFDDSSPMSAFDTCLHIMSDSIYRDTGQFNTPASICDISQQLFGEIHTGSGSILDFNARTGEWGEYAQNANPQNRLAVTHLCFDTCHYLLAKMRALLINNSAAETILLEQYNLSEVKPNHYDFVVSNPPFGKVVNSKHRSDSGTKEAFFLRHALLTCKENGKIAFVVPEGFLFRKDQGYRDDFDLRQELTDSKAIKAVIRLPDSTFYPYAKIRTALLFIDKSQENQTVTFIDITKSPSSLSDLDIANINKLVNESIDAPEITHAVIDQQQLLDSGYDWQVHKYIKSGAQREQRAANLISGELAKKETKLLQVKAQIAKVIAHMGVTK